MAKVKYGNMELVAALEDYRDDMEKWVKKGIYKVTNVIANTAKAQAPVDDGNLRKSITTNMRDGGFTGVINVGANYAIYVEYGTGVYAKGLGGSRAKSIPWTYYSDKLNRWVTTKGQHAQPFWNPAIDAGRKEFNKYFS